MTISRNKWIKVHARMERLGVREADLLEHFTQGSGPGGQKINKTASCVFLSYEAERIQIKCQVSRSRELNRLHARHELCDRLERQIKGRQREVDSALAKERARNRRPSGKEKAKMAVIKKKQSQKKQNRQKPRHDD